MADLLERLKVALADRYRIERELGAGGMATVYLAEDLKHHRKVAVKVLRPELAAALGAERFLQEIEIAAQLQHPHILPLHDSGEADGFLFYVMPYVEGESLRDKLAKEGELPVGDAVRILRDVVDALTEAHAHGVVHRDVKPENILLRGRHALVADFGVAKAVSEATSAYRLTTEGVALGTPAYMSPEQAAADKHIDHRADIYAVGVVAYELLTGRPPFLGTTPQMILSAHMMDTPEPVAKYRESVPPALAQLVMKCLEKKAADRWQSAEDLLPQLEALATPSGGVTPTDTRPMAGIAGRRRWLVPAAAAVAVLSVIVVALSQMLAPSPITITTSNIRPVTSEPGMEWQPALSPDGSQVAFVARRGDRQSVVIRSTIHVGGGEEFIPAQGLHDRTELLPAWSPDGEFVRFVSCLPESTGPTPCSVREVMRLGGSARPINLPRNTILASWSPDGARIAFITFPTDSIFTFSIDDRAATLLAVHGTQRGIHSLVWSPDGRRVAYVEGPLSWLLSFDINVSSIWIMDTDSGEPVRVTSDDFMDVSPAWLDEDHLLFISNRDGLREVYVIEVGPSGPRGEPRKVPGATDPHSISYSIAANKLAFSKATARQNIWSYSIGSGPVSIRDGVPVTSENAVIELHDISPDGEWIVYQSNLRGNADIYKKPLDGGSALPITDSPLHDYAPQWSPDGTEIVFTRDAGGGEYTVMVVPADGGTPSQVVGRAISGLVPRFSPSGLDIAFVSGRIGHLVMWIVSRDTIGGSWGEARQLTEFECVPQDWEPNGDHVLCSPLSYQEIMLVSREGEVSWRYELATAGLRAWSWWYLGSRYSWDGSVIYLPAIHEDGLGGIWEIPLHGGEPSLVVESYEFMPPFLFSVGPDHLYVTVADHESDIWVMDVEVER